MIASLSTRFRLFNWRNQGRSELPKEVRIRVPRGGVIKNVPFCFRDVELK